MARHGVRRLVVVDAGALAGVVTLDDIASRVGDRASAVLGADHATGDA
jgi:CBS domain-containing protein